MRGIQVFSCLVFFLVAGLGIYGPAYSYETYTKSLQAGQYMSYDVDGPYTGLMREDGSSIGAWDDVSVFSWPEHIEADLQL